MTSPPAPRRRSGKARDVIAILERRVRGGDYLVAPLPSTRDLAAELGVSYVTARKALLALQERGLLARGATRRLMLAAKDSGSRIRQIAFLAPAYPSADVIRWLSSIKRIASDARCAIKSHFYDHWDDPALLDIIERGDGAFLYPTSALPSATIERRIRSRAHRVVVVDRDWSGLGLPSICLSPARFIAALLDHCAAAGHRRIVCLNTQPHDDAIAARLQQYQEWAQAHGMPADLIDVPVVPGEDSAVRARDALAAALGAGRPAFTCLFATTASAAMGALRALRSAGIAAGEEIAVCTLNDEGLGDMLVPSLTAQAAPDPDPYIKRGLAWILHPERQWRGKLLIQPEACAIAARESTAARAPVPRS